MTAAAVIAALAALLLLPLVVAAVRQRTLLAMAVRNIGRRRAEAALVVAGALLGTAIITSSLVVGDIVEGSFADAPRRIPGNLVGPGRRPNAACMSIHKRRQNCRERLVSNSMRRALWLLVAGLTAVAACHLAVELLPARWGGPNIGGGFILLLAYGAIVAGLTLAIIACRDGR